MKFEKGNTANGINIPPAALKLSGFESGEPAEYHTATNVVVVVKKNMTALELIQAVWSLICLSERLTQKLIAQCSSCEGQCGSCDGECPYHWSDFAVDFSLPEDARELGGISERGVTHIEFHEDGIHICESSGEPGLWDVPLPVMESLLRSGVCPASLEILLKSGEAVYGE